MSRIEVLIFASPTPVPRAVPARMVSKYLPLDALIADIRNELRPRTDELVAVAAGWHHRPRPHLASMRRAVRPTSPALLALGPSDQLLLATFADHKPVTRRDLERLLGRTVDSDTVGVLRAAGLVGPGPRSPRPAAPLTIGTTDAFLDQFGLESLADLPDLNDLRAMGLSDTGVLDGAPAGGHGATAATASPTTTSFKPASHRPHGSPNGGGRCVSPSDGTAQHFNVRERRGCSH